MLHKLHKTIKLKKNGATQPLKTKQKRELKKRDAHLPHKHFKYLRYRK